MRNTPKSKLLLLELLCDLVIFALCAAVCVALLVQARSMSRESSALTQAVYLAQSMAEEYRSTGVAPTAGSTGEAGFTSTLDPTGDGLDIAIWKDGRLVYELKGVAAP